MQSQFKGQDFCFKFPPILREEVESVQEIGESMATFIRTSLRAEIRRRKLESTKLMAAEKLKEELQAS